MPKDVDMTATEAPMDGAEDDGVPDAVVPLDEDLDLAQRVFDYERTRDDAVKEGIMDELKRRNMLSMYVGLCEKFSWAREEAVESAMGTANASAKDAIEAKIADAIENLGDVEVRDAMWERSGFYASIGEREKAFVGYEETEAKTASIGQKMDGVFAVMRLRFASLDLAAVKVLIAKIKDMLEQPGGGDWERKNRLKVYEGLYCAATRDFSKATTLFLESLSTFTTYELLSYENYIFYTVVCAVVSLPRTELKAKVIDSPEVLSVLNRLPGLGDFLNALHKCDYRTFMSAFPVVAAEVEKSVWLNPHYRYFLREVRVVAYAQYLQSYKSVTVSSMAESFNVSDDFIDRELSHFIVSGRLNCKIDKVSGVLQTNRPDMKNALYQSLIKDGDALLNRVQKLSRVIDM
jgi:26S proteasome regulatory subunit N7